MIIARQVILSLIATLERFGAPIVDLFLRIAVFRVFFWSGLVKIQDWQGTVQLFRYEYMVPILPPSWAALLGTSFELGASSLILVGLITRLAVLPLLGMSLIIQFVLGASNPAYNQLEHYLWMVLLLQLLVRGPGILSIDHWLRGRQQKSAFAAPAR